MTATFLDEGLDTDLLDALEFEESCTMMVLGQPCDRPAVYYTYTACQCARIHLVCEPCHGRIVANLSWYDDLIYNCVKCNDDVRGRWFTEFYPLT